MRATCLKGRMKFKDFQALHPIDCSRNNYIKYSDSVSFRTREIVFHWDIQTPRRESSSSSSSFYFLIILQLDWPRDSNASLGGPNKYDMQF